MQKRRTKVHGFAKAVIAVLAVGGLVAACGPAAVSPQQVAGQIATGVALTVQAENGIATNVAGTVAVLMPAAASQTPTSQTPLILPTLTPLATVTPFVVPSGGGGGGGSGGGGGGGGGSGACKDKQRCCEVVDQEPEDWPDPHSILKVGDKLDVNFDIKNVGTLTWDPTWTWEYWRTAVDTSEPANVDLTTSSVGLQSTLGQSVEPGHYIRLGIELTAPDFQGREPIKIETHWAIKGDGARFCTPFSYIEVIQPGMTP